MTNSAFRDLFSQEQQGIYLDNAASTRKMRCMVEAMQTYDLDCGVNIGRGSYRSSRQAEAAVAAAREKIKEFLSAGEDNEVIFTHGATDGLNLLARSIAAKITPGSNVVTTVAEHLSNLLPWMEACKQRGGELRLAKPNVKTDAKGNRIISFQTRDIMSLVDEKTVLITVTGCSNVTGSCLPVKEIAQEAARMHIPVVVDGAQLVAHKKVMFSDLGCDAFCFSTHKLYGPTGLGVMCTKKDFLSSLEPDVYGGGTVDYVDLTQGVIGRKDGASSWEAGTLPISQILGFSAVLDKLRECGMDTLQVWEEELRRHLLAAMDPIPGIRCIHSGEDGTPTVSLCCDFMSSLDLAAMCDANRIAVRAGKHCAHPLLDFLGEPATVRVSLAAYNTAEQIDALADLLGRLQRRFGK